MVGHTPHITPNLKILLVSLGKEPWLTGWKFFSAHLLFGGKRDIEVTADMSKAVQGLE